jgi:hypothetical protein
MKALRILVWSSLLTAGVAAGLAPTRALAQPPASIPDASASPAHDSFQTFAAEWMQRLHRVEAQNKSSVLGNGSTTLSYRGFDQDFKTELRSTGNPKAPYVGMIRYLEREYRCSDSRALDCRVEKTTPITEVFRFQDGRWVY